MGTVHRIAKNTGVLFAGQIASHVFIFLYMMYAARYLGPSDFGILTFALAFTGIFGVICDFGLQPLTVREVARNRSLASKYLSNIVGLKIILGTFCLGLIVLVINLLDYPDKTLTVVYLLALSIVLKAFNSMFYSIFQAYEKMEYQSLGQILNSFLMLVGVVFAMKWKLEVTGFSAVYFTVSTAILIYSLMVLKINFPDVYLPWRHRIIEIDWPFWRATFTEAFPFGIAMTFMVIFYWIDSVMLSLMKGNTVVGYYNASYRIVLALQFIPNSFITAIYPVMSKYYETSRNSLEASFVNSFTYLLILGVPIGFGTTILAKPIISLIYGIDYTLSVPALQILIWSMVFIFMSQPFGNLFNCVNRQAVVSKTTGICVGLNIILNIILIPKYSLIGASIATLITEVASLILLVFWSTEIFLTIPDAKTLAVTGAKILISSAVMSLYTLYFINMSLFALIPSATVLYFIVLFFLNGISGKDISFIMNLIKWR